MSICDAEGKELFIQDLFGGADKTHRLATRIYTEYAWHSLFIQNLLIEPKPEELDSFFSDTWFEQSFLNWEDVRKINVCFDGDVTLHEFDLAFRDAGDNVSRYGLRYWIEPVSETRVRAWHIAIATSYADGRPNPDGETLLDDYAARIYPDLPTCPR